MSHKFYFLFYFRVLQRMSTEHSLTIQKGNYFTQKSNILISNTFIT